MPSLNFDASTVEPAAAKGPIPAGRYLAIITASEQKPTKSATGSYLEFTYQIIDGPLKGRKLWSRHNLQNPSAQAVAIAHGELSAVCRAVGVMKPDDSAQLHNLPLVLSVRVAKRTDTGEPTNEITGWAKKDAATGAPQQATTTPPWLRGRP